MIDNGNFYVVYFDENYEPARRKNSKKDLLDYQPKSGTKVAYEYALKKKIINELDLQEYITIHSNLKVPKVQK